MDRIKLIICLLLCIVIFRSSCLYAQMRTEGTFSKGQGSEQLSTPPCVKVGEKFTYTLTWGIIPAGTATLGVDSIVRWGGGVDCYQIKIASSTNSFLDKIHKVRDTVVSLIETSLKRSHYYRKKQQEGSFSRDDELTIDYQKEEVILNRGGKLKNTIKMQSNEDLLDPYGVLYYVRSLDLKVGDKISARVTDGSAVYQMQINVLKRERIKSWIGYFDCLKIEPKMQKIEGVFNKKLEAKLFIWLTNDYRKIPVKMQSEVFIGSVQGLLKEIHDPQLKINNKKPKNIPDRAEKVSKGY